MKKSSTNRLGILIACFGMLWLSAPASASLCGVSISTTWTANEGVSEGSFDSSFDACNTSSRVEGDFHSEYEFTVEAIDDDPRYYLLHI